MKINIILLAMTCSGAFYITPQYKPQKYEQYLAQTIAALKEKKHLIEQKLAAQQARELQTSKKSLLTTTLAREGNYKALLEASKVARASLETTQRALENRIKLLETEKSKLATSPLASEAEENRLIQKMSLEQSIAELQNQLIASRQTERLVQNYQAGKAFAQKQQTQLQDRLKMLQSDLAQIK